VLVSGGDEEGLAAAIPMARCMDRVAIREQALERFEFDVMADTYEELLAEAATGMAAHEEAAAA